MTDKQIFKRLNEAYTSIYGDDVADEWFGTDEIFIWKFRRPAKNLYVKLVLDVDDRTVTIFESSSNSSLKFRGVYSF